MIANNLPFQEDGNEKPAKEERNKNGKTLNGISFLVNEEEKQNGNIVFIKKKTYIFTRK
jgi:hypothetical protein